MSIVCITSMRQKFLSPPSARRATLPSAWLERPARISIPALREEGDYMLRHYFRDSQFISIPALREEGDKWHPTKLSLMA